MHKIEYILVKSLFSIFQKLSFQSGKRAGQVLAILIGTIFHYRRRVVVKNLHLVYGQKLPGPKKQLLHAIYRNFAYLWMEVLQSPRLTRKNLEERIRLHNREVIDKALEKGKGLILISAHLGNFEWIAHLFAFLGYRMNAIAKRQSNPYVNAFIEKVRTRSGTQVIYTKDATREGIRVLNKNEILGFVADQDARHRGVFVEFMGQPSSTAVGPAVFHLRSAAPICMIIVIRRDYGRFDVYFEDVLDALPEAQKITDRRIQEITQLHTSKLEKWIRQYPQQWFWTHRRWKTQPEEFSAKRESE